MRFPYFTIDTAFDLGCTLRAKFLADQAAGKYPGKGAVISIATVAGNTLFACNVGNESRIPGQLNWNFVEGKTTVVKLNNRSSYFARLQALHRGQEVP